MRSQRVPRAAIWARSMSLSGALRTIGEGPPATGVASLRVADNSFTTRVGNFLITPVDAFLMMRFHIVHPRMQVMTSSLVSFAGRLGEGERARRSHTGRRREAVRVS